MYYTIKETTLQGIEDAIASGSKDFSTLAGIVDDMRAVPVFNNMYLVGDEELTDMADEVRSDNGVVHIGSIEQIVVDKNTEKKIIAFYVWNHGIDEIWYVEEGMTWREWVNSNYNTVRHKPGICEYNGIEYIGTIAEGWGLIEYHSVQTHQNVLPSDVIIEGTNYDYYLFA